MGNDLRSQHGGAQRFRLGASALGIVAAICAAAAVQDAGAAERVRRGSNADRNSGRMVTQSLASQQEPPSGPERTIQVGASYESASDGERTRSVPFLMSYAPGRWYFEISGDGITNVKAGEERKRGFADIALVVTHTSTYGSGRYGIEPEVEVDLPTDGEVGSGRPSQALRLNLRAKLFGSLAVKLTGSMSHDGDEAGPGVSRDSRTLAAKLTYEWKRGIKTAVSAARVRRDGAFDKTVWGGELEAPLSDRLTAIVSVGRKSNADGSARSGQFDLAYVF